MRADVYLVTAGHVSSRTLAQKLITSACVSIDGRMVSKPSEEVSDVPHDVVITPIDEMRYVSRGGLKLEGALETFAVDVAGLVVADVGASTGGFTHCLLTHGATRVYAIDSGHGQLDPSLVKHPQVRSMEGVNARHLTCGMLADAELSYSSHATNPDGSSFDGRVDGVVMDVSFISQTLLHPAIASIVKNDGFFISLIKPQFEVGRAGLGKHGIVKSQKYRDEAVQKVLSSAEICGFSLQKLMTSPIEGGDGNMEFLGYFLKKN